ALIANLGDYAYSAESGTMWVFNEEFGWQNSNVTNPEDVVPKSMTVPKKDGQIGSIGEETAYAAGDHVHPLNTSTAKPLANSGTGSAGSASTYARSDHVHPEISNMLLNSIGSVQGYGNVITDLSIVDNEIAPQKNSTFVDIDSTQTILGEKTFQNNITATGYKIPNGTDQQLLLADGSNTSLANLVTTNTDQTITGSKIFKNNQLQIQNLNGNPLTVFNYNNNFLEQMLQGEELVLTMNSSQNKLYINYRSSYLTSQFPNVKAPQAFILNAGSSTSYAKLQCGNVHICPTNSSFDDGLRIARTVANTGSSSIHLGCSRTLTTGNVVGQWTIQSPISTYTNNPLGLIIVPASQAGDNTNGLQISSSCTKLTFNGSDILTAKQAADFNSIVSLKSYQHSSVDVTYWQCFATMTVPVSSESYGSTIDIFNTYTNDLFYQLKWNMRRDSSVYNIQFNATQYGTLQTDFMICADTPSPSPITLRFYMKQTSVVYNTQWNINVSNFSSINCRDKFILQENSNEYNITTDTLPTGTQFAKLAIQNKFINNGGIINGILQINSGISFWNQGIRISRSTSGSASGIHLGCDPNSTNGTLQDQWTIITTSTREFRIGVNQQTMNGQGLQISADGNILSFNGVQLSGTGQVNTFDSVIALDNNTWQWLPILQVNFPASGYFSVGFQLQVIGIDYVANVNDTYNQITGQSIQLFTRSQTVQGGTNTEPTGLFSISNEDHYRGYYQTNEEIQALIANAGDYAFSAESMTLWVYNEQYQWVNTNVDTPQEIIPKSTTVPQMDGVSGTIGEETSYAAGDHVHPMNTSTDKPLMNSGTGSAGTAASYARSDHVHPIDSNLMSNSILGVQGEGNAITEIQIYENQLILYKLATFIDTVSTQTITGAKTFTTPITVYEATASDLLTSGGYKSETNFVRTTNAIDETITGNKTFNNSVIAAGYKIPNGTGGQVLLANGESKAISDIVNDSVKKTGEELQVIQGTIRKKDDDEESIDCDYLTRKEITDNYVTVATD
ncbi:MAG: hypothetical protein EZS28_026461, partial [Streblomastix strix]